MGGARSAATRPRDVVASAFPQTPASRTLSGHREAASGLHVADGNVTILGKELKACSVTERCGSQCLRLLLRGPRAASAVKGVPGRS